MNPRFAHYARVHGVTPDEMMRIDGERWPGGRMCGFLFWSSACLYEFSGVQTGAFFDSTRPYSITNNLVDHAAYDAWLGTLPVGHGVDDAKPSRVA